MLTDSKEKLTNKAVHALISHLLNKHYIGAKHTEENRLIKSKTKWISAKERKDFEKQYKTLLNKHLLMRVKKKTGKGSDWHISINPKHLCDVYNLIK